MSHLWLIWCNRKQTSCLENFEPNTISVKPDPWLGNSTYNIARGAGTHKTVVKLLCASTHINLLVDLAKSWKLVPNKVLNHLDQGIIVNMSCDPFAGWEDYVAEELTKYTDNFVVLSGDATYLNHAKNSICFVPYLYLWQKYSYNATPAQDQSRTYRISCMNKVARYHRIENFIKLRRRPYFDQLLFNMWYHYDKKTIKRQTVRKFYNEQIIKEFESLLPEQPGLLHDDAHRIDLPAWTDSYTNLVTETSVYDNTVFVSEKTWKPFMSGQFGLWLSNPGTVAHLRSLGFDLFDDVFFDHSYDKETNLNHRIDMIHATIDRFMTMDTEQIWKATLPRRQANVDRFYSQDLENLLTAQCEKYQHLV